MTPPLALPISLPALLLAQAARERLTKVEAELERLRAAVRSANDEPPSPRP